MKKLLSIHKLSYLCILLYLSSIVAASLGPSPAHAKEKLFDEPQVKAVFLYNLTKFVSWSPNKTVSSNSAFFIGMLGEDRFNGLLEKVVIGETVNGRKIDIKYLNEFEDIPWGEIDLLFVSNFQKTNLHQILKHSIINGVLLVGGEPGFGEAGGMVNLLTHERRVKIEVNIHSLKKSGLSMNAQVLKLSKIIRTH